MSISIAIDGPSGSGKSTIAKAIATRLGFVHIDTGAMYRAVALHTHRAGINWGDETTVMSALDGIDIDIVYADGTQRIFLGDEDVTQAVRTAEMGVGASRVSPHPSVRKKLIELQRQLAKSRNVIMDGRDIGTVVLPDAVIKIFLTASLQARVARRCHELSAMGLAYDPAEIASQIEKRDYDDSIKNKVLLQADDAVAVDTSDMGIDEVVIAILHIAKKKGVLDV